ncbi:MAG: hypothetical protein ACK5IJ_10395 [Mangrovibacterium sp.]
MKKSVENIKKRRVIIGVILIFLAVCFVLATFFAQRLLEREISKYLSNSTHGGYTIDLGNVDVNLFNHSASIYDYTIKGTPRNDESYYEVSGKEIKIRNLALRKLFFDRVVQLHGLTLIEPRLSIYAADKIVQDSTQMFSLEELTHQLKPFFSTSIRAIDILNFELQQADISYRKASEPDVIINSIKKLDISIDDLKLNAKIIDEQKLFESGNIILQMLDFSCLLSDKRHQLHFGKFTYKWDDKSFYGEKLHIHPIDSSAINVPMYWIDLPYLSVKADVASLTKVDSIVLDSVLVLDAKIRYRPKKAESQFHVEQLEHLNLYGLIKDDFKKIAINYLKLDAKEVMLESADTIRSPHFLNDMCFEASGFEIDSLAELNEQKLLYADNFSFWVKKYSYLLKNKAQQIEASAVQMNTLKRFLKANEIRLTQVDSLSMPTNLSITCDSVCLDEILLTELIHEQRLPIKQMRIYRPRGVIEHVRKEHKADKPKSLHSAAYHLINNYVDEISAEAILIEDGRVEVFDKRGVSDGYVGSSFRVELNDLKLNTESINQSERLFNAKRFDILLSDYSMDLNDNIHQLDFDTVHISSQQERLDLKNAHLHPRSLLNMEQVLQDNHKKSLFNIQLPHLSLENANFLEAFFHKQLLIDKFEINQPSIGIEIFDKNNRRIKANRDKLDFNELYQILQAHLNRVQINELLLSNARLNYTKYTSKGTQIDFENEFTLKLEHFLLNENTMKQVHKLPAESFQFYIQNHTFHLPDGVHNIYADVLSYSSKDSSIQAENVKLFANSTSINYKNSPWLYDITVPQIAIQGINLEAISFDKRVDLSQLKLKNARIQLSENFKSQKIRKRLVESGSPLQFKMPQEIDEFSLRNISLENSKLSILKRVNGKFQTEISALVNSQFNDLKIGKDSLGKASFKVDDYEFSLKNFRRVSPTGDEQLSFSNFLISSQEKMFDLKDFEIKRIDEEGVYNRFIYIPGLKVFDIDTRNLVDFKDFRCSKLVLYEPVLNLELVQASSGSNDKLTSSFYWKISPKLMRFVHQFNLGELEIQNAQVQFPQRYSISSIDRLCMNLNKVHVDSVESLRLFASESFNFSTSAMNFETELYQFKLSEAAFSSLDKRFDLAQVELTPLFTPDEHQKYFSFQNDYFFIRLKEMQAKGVDVERLISDKKLFVDKLSLNGLGFFSYRDKRLPFNTANRPLMPQRAIQEIPLPMNIDTIELRNSSFTYSERLPISPESYKITFNETNALLYPFTNIPSILYQQPTMQLQARTKLQGMSDIYVHVDFDMLSDSCNFKLNAEVYPLDLSLISEITDNAALVSIKSGMLNKMLIEFNANERASSGTLSLDYEDLSITALKYKRDKIKQRKMMSMLANMFVPSKTSQAKSEVQGRIYFERDESKSIFNYWWKSIFSGLSDFMGFTEKKEKSS